MKRFLISACFLLLVPFFALAQREVNTEERAQRMEERRAQMMKERNEKLNLSEEQIEQLDKINQEYSAKIMGQKQMEREERRAQLRSVNEWRTEEIRKVLDDEQFETWSEMQYKRQERGISPIERPGMERRREGKKEKEGKARSRTERGPRGSDTQDQ